MSYGTNKASYGPLTPVVITLDSVAVGAARQSASVNGILTGFMDLLFELSFTLAGAPNDGGTIGIYMAASGDGTFWPDAVTGEDDDIVIGHVGRLLSLGLVPCPTAGPNNVVWPALATVGAQPIVIPAVWSLVVANYTSQELIAGEIRYQGRQITGY